MARPLRIEYPDAVYHVSNRGLDNKRIFPSVNYNKAFIGGLAEACRRLNVKVHALCLLPNEYHLLIATPEGNLSRFMRQVDGLYTQNFQRLKKSHGSVFRARYKSVLIQSGTWLLPLTRYIHNLPSTKRQDPMKYEWSTLSDYLSRSKGPEWLDKEAAYEQLGVSSKAVSTYRDYINNEIEPELKQFYARKNILSVLGDSKFVTSARKKGRSNTTRGVSRGAAARQRPSIKTVVTAVAEEFGVEEKSIYKAARGPGSRNIPRWVAMYLCQEVAGVTLQNIANRFGLQRYGTVSTTIGKLKQELSENPKIQPAINRILRKLSS